MIFLFRYFQCFVHLFVFQSVLILIRGSEGGIKLVVVVVVGGGGSVGDEVLGSVAWGTDRIGGRYFRCGRSDAIFALYSCIPKPGLDLIWI